MHNLSFALSTASLLLLILLCLVLFQYICSKNKRLPPGSMGWPYLGETLTLYTQNPDTFFTRRTERYGDIFKTRILGCPCVIISSPEAARFVLVSRANLFKPTYPPSKQKIIGPEAIFFQQGEYHSRLKRLVQRSFHPSSIKPLVTDIEQLVTQILPLWDNKIINTLKEMKRFSLEVGMLLAFGKGSGLDIEAMKHLYHHLDGGYNSIPINIIGTKFRNAMNARRRIDETLRKEIKKRRGCLTQDGGLFGILLNSDDHLTDSQIADNIVGLIFAARDTTASIMTWILKNLHDHPKFLEAVRKEQENIRDDLLEGNRKLNWEDTRRMQLTSRVIQETLRTASVLSFTFREAVEDVEFDGYLIPKGWKVLPLFRTIHYSPNFFPEPHKFDPSRFEVPPRPNTYIPFGNGTHSCPGSELAKLEMLILIHHLTTTYRWAIVGKELDGIQYDPFPVPKMGLPIRVERNFTKLDQASFAVTTKR